MSIDKKPEPIDIATALNTLIKSEGTAEERKSEIDDLVEEIAFQLTEYLDIIERAKRYEDPIGKLSEMNKIAIRAEKFIIEPVKKLKNDVLKGEEYEED